AVVGGIFVDQGAAEEPELQPGAVVEGVEADHVAPGTGEGVDHLIDAVFGNVDMFLGDGDAPEAGAAAGLAGKDEVPVVAGGDKAVLAGGGVEQAAEV